MKLLLYCTKSKPYLLKLKDKDVDFFSDYKKYFLCALQYKDKFKNYALNGKVVAECDFEVEKMGLDTGKGLVFDKGFNKESQLELFEIAKYVGNDYYYAIHIKNLHIFDEPKELKDLEPKREIHQCIHSNLIIDEELEIPIKAPQNMMRVKLKKSYYNGIPVSNDDINANEETLEDYILISIHPEWLCKILNGEKTIEVRKKVLKEMLK